MRTRISEQHGQSFSASLRSITSRWRGRVVGFGNRGSNGRCHGFVEQFVEECRTFDPFGLAAEGHLHELGNVICLFLDRAAKLTDEGEDFLELGFEVRVVGEQLGDLLAEGDNFVLR